MGKIKVGTQIEEELYHQLKLAAARERRPVGALMQDAVTSYLHRQGKNGLMRLLERGPTFAVSDAEHREIMEADFYDQ